MAEISYPFPADNATTGAAKAVSVAQWQSMAHLWGGDKVDFRLTAATYSSVTLPFTPKILSVTSVQIGPGKAWVGGFYYELTANQNVAISANSASTDRIDLIVLRADMAKPSVNLAVRKGVNAATPVEPKPVRQAGGMWELPLYAITVPANGGTIGYSSRAPYDMPAAVSFPWNAALSVDQLPAGTFGYDLDSNNDGLQHEYFNGADGTMITRTLGVSRSYTPALINGAVPAIELPNIVRTGHWKWIAPNTVWFSAQIKNNLLHDVSAVSGAWYLGVSLPSPAKGVIGQVFHGILDNNTSAMPNTSYPNLTSLTGWIMQGGDTSTVALMSANTNNLKNGLDGHQILPARASITISGVYEATQL
ncbi:hypothetical protein OHB13_11890 [Streptomyces sp. NBC_00440]|uniref:hypothetical protein n=1 Tax=Streptomyces sp. NBC_00440 TaxID=2975741 RepID=UPI002E1F998C